MSTTHQHTIMLRARVVKNKAQGTRIGLEKTSTLDSFRKYKGRHRFSIFTCSFRGFTAFPANKDVSIQQ